jgi:hypothetical protein
MDENLQMKPQFNLSGLNGISDETLEIISRRKKLVNEPALAYASPPHYTQNIRVTVIQ